MATIKAIEEKAKRYDEAVEKLRSLHDNYDTVSTLIDIKEELENIFPELKESENERIRKSIIGFLITISSLKDGKTVSNEDFDSKAILEWVAWLEKQGEQKPAKKVEPKFNVGQTIKKEGFNLGFTIVKIEDGFYYNDMCDYFPFTDQDNWVLVEQKPAWSEEDESMCKETIDWFERKCFPYALESENPAKESIKWLKSLKDKYTWKPSNEQMSALDAVIDEYDGYPEFDSLVSLKNDLKKLMEE